MAQSVFRDCPRLEKLEQIVRTAGFGADAGELQAAKGLSFDNGTGDAAVDVEIAYAKITACFVDMGRRTGEIPRPLTHRLNDSRFPTHD